VIGVSTEKESGAVTWGVGWRRFLDFWERSVSRSVLWSESMDL
jgi:hypothetical protein